MGKYSQFAGLFGLVLLGFALIAGFVVGFDIAVSTPLIILHLAGGVVLLLWWIFATGAQSVGIAGKVMTGRAARFGYSSTFFIAVFGALFAIALYFGQRYDKRWDLTEQGVYSLAPASRDVLEKLSKPLKVVALRGPAVSRPGGDDGETKEILDLVHGANPSKITTERFDPQAKPQLVEKYGFKPGNMIYLEYGEGETKGVSRINDVSEEALVNAVIKLKRGEAKKIYYLTGHDEPGLTSSKPDGLQALSGALTDQSLTLEDLFIGEKAEVPSDAAAVLVVSPKKPFGPGEREALIKYADKGGRLVLLHDPRTTNDITEIAKNYQIEIGNNVVIDQVQRLFAAPALGAQPVVRSYGYHPITKDFTKNNVTIFNIASTVTAKGSSNKDIVTYSNLLTTGQTAWGESNIDALFAEEPAAEYGDGDIRGPVTLGVAYEKKIKAEKDGDPDKFTRIVVIGDSDWVLNANLGVYANRDLILNTINWVAGEEGGLSISARSIRASVAPIGESDFYKILGGSLLVPELILLSGLLVWWRRKTSFA